MKQRSRKRILVAAALVVLGLCGVSAARATCAIARPVNRFIHFYQATESPIAPMSAWERILFSLALVGRSEPAVTTD